MNLMRKSANVVSANMVSVLHRGSTSARAAQGTKQMSNPKLGHPTDAYSLLSDASGAICLSSQPSNNAGLDVSLQSIKSAY